MNRPDFSMYLAHFCKDGDFFNSEQSENIRQFQSLNAKERLISILRERTIYMSNIPWTNTPCVCLTECPWSSLLAHTQKYSPYGIGFTKKYLFKHGGGPALYVRVDIFKKIRDRKQKGLFSKEDISLWPYITPFSPKYGNKYRLLNDWVDYTHEREWRIPQNLTFNYSDISFIIIKSVDDYTEFPIDIKGYIRQFGVKIIIMDNYKLIEDLWPVHLK